VLNTPTGLVFNSGSLYIADQDNQRVRQIGAGGTISTVAGDGMPSFAGDGLQAVNASLYSPDGLAFDASGKLYIADSTNDRVRLVNPTGIISTFAGDGTATGFGGEGDPATLTPLNQPRCVVADTAGNVYISDTGHNRIIQVDASGNIHTVAGTGTAGAAGGGGTALGELYGPTGLALDSAGDLYIADTQNQRIQELTAGGTISTIAGTGTAGFTGDGGAAAVAELNYPSAVAIDASGNLYIADTGNNRVRMVTAGGMIATIAGTGIAAYNGDTGAALDMALYNPGGLALDGLGDLFVADTGNNRIRMLSAAQTVVTPPPLVNVTLANSASLLPGPLAPGEIFSIFGQGIGPQTAATGAFDATGMLSTAVSGVQVLFNGTPAPLYYVQSQQINAQVPYEVAGQMTWTRRQRRLDELDPFNQMLAVLETAAHLDLLVLQGRLRALVSDGVTGYVPR